MTNIAQSRKPQASPTSDEIRLVIHNPIAARIRAIHARDGIGELIGNRTSLEKYCIEIIENFITDKRKML